MLTSGSYCSMYNGRSSGTNLVLLTMFAPTVSGFYGYVDEGRYFERTRTVCKVLQIRKYFHNKTRSRSTMVFLISKRLVSANLIFAVNIVNIICTQSSNSAECQNVLRLNNNNGQSGVNSFGQYGGVFPFVNTPGAYNSGSLFGGGFGAATSSTMEYSNTLMTLRSAAYSSNSGFSYLGRKFLKSRFVIHLHAKKY